MQRRSAFTLIELLVVIAIIALLVSILMPSLQVAKEMAKDVVCRSHQKNVSYAIFLYAEDNNDIYPYVGWAPDTHPFVTWAVKVGRIADSNEILPYTFRGGDDDDRSPTGARRMATQGYIDYNYNAEEEDGHFHCPAFQDQVNPKSLWSNATDCQFSMNGSLTGVFNEEYGDPDEVRVVRTTDVGLRSVLIGDGNLNPGGEIRVQDTFRPDPQDDAGRLDEMPWEVGTGWFSFGPWPTQHFVNKWGPSWPCDFPGHPGKRANLCFTDGSLESVKPIKPDDWKIQ